VVREQGHRGYDSYVISARATRQLAEWPELPYEAWAPTMETLHMKLQIIGKIRLALTRRNRSGPTCRSTSRHEG